jgi:hypothetical protein
MNIGISSAEVLDANPAEISPGVFLPATSVRAVVGFEGFTIKIVVTIRSRQPQCEVLTVESRGGQLPVTATTLRAIPVASIVEQVMLGVFGSPFRLVDGRPAPVSTQSAIEEREQRMPRRLLMPRVVDEYRSAVRAQSRRPIQDVAELLGYQPKYISKLVNEARKDGLLGPARLGKSGELETGGTQND